MSEEKFSVEFNRSLSASPEADFTGERFLPHLTGEIAWEHLHRYSCALEIARGLDVLDIACGEGYGSYMLSQVAKSVVGVDIDAPSVKAASAKYAVNNLRFEEGSCQSIPAGDASFDLVVSFETIEHILEQEAFLDEVLRVLKPDGMLLISSPERAAYDQAREGTANEFHLKELSYDEFKTLLQNKFKHVDLSRQLTLFGSFIAASEVGGPSQQQFCRVLSASEGRIHGGETLTRGAYVLGLCCKEDKKRILPASLFDPQLPSNLLSALEGGIRERDGQRILDSNQIAHLLERERELERVLAEHRDAVQRQAEVLEHQDGILQRQARELRVHEETQNKLRARQVAQVAALDMSLHRQRLLTDAALESMATAQDSDEPTKRTFPVHVPSLRTIIRGWRMDLAAVPLIARRPEFDASFYSKRFAGLPAGRLLAIVHYQLVGWKRDRSPFRGFDSAWYRNFYGDVQRTHCSPLTHYFKHGMFEGRTISATDEARRKRVVQEEQEERVREELVSHAQLLRSRLDSLPAMVGDLGDFTLSVARLRHAMVKDAAEHGGMSLPDVLTKVCDIKRDVLSSSTLRAPYDEAPEVSIVIPVYNQIRSTLSCIESVVRHQSRVSFEIVVVDDCSTDVTVTACKSIPELVVVEKDKNSGFIDSCNRGARVARGKKVVFLNNDTYVLPQWLDSLVETFTSHPSVGLVGSQLLYPDGTLQEAGGIIWSDGNAWNYGRNQNAALGEFNYLRDVDFCSGASIMLDRDLFLHLGGFDSHYAPAYCEDVDLAFKIRKNGLRVVYQPFSRLIHFEGVSSGTDVNVGVKSYQVANLEKIKTRWAGELTKHAPSNVLPEVARDYHVKGRIFFVDAVTPTPDQDAGSIVADTWLRALVELGYHVTFLSYHSPGYMPHYTERLERMGVHALIPPTSLDIDTFIAKFGSTYDVIVGLRHATAEPIFRTFEKYGFNPKKLFLPIDLHYVRELRQAELENSESRRTVALETKKQELSVVGESDIILVHSSFEQDELMKELPGSDVRVSPIITDVMGCETAFEDRKDICFVGGFQHPPNLDAVTFFVKEVLPLVVKEIADIVFKVIGSKPPAELEQFRGPNVEILGFVQDLEPIWSSVRLSVAPLRFGAGVKGKVCMSLSYGVPVVCTPIAAEGMGLRDGEEVLLGATAEELAAQVIRLYREPVLWGELSAAGMKLVEKEFSTATNRQRIEEYLADVGFGHGSFMGSSAA